MLDMIGLFLVANAATNLNAKATNLAVFPDMF